MEAEHMPENVTPSGLREQEVEEDESGNTVPAFLSPGPSPWDCAAHIQGGFFFFSHVDQSWRTSSNRLKHLWLHWQAQILGRFFYLLFFFLFLLFFFSDEEDMGRKIQASMKAQERMLMCFVIYPWGQEHAVNNVPGADPRRVVLRSWGQHSAGWKGSLKSFLLQLWCWSQVSLWFYVLEACPLKCWSCKT